MKLRKWKMCTYTRKFNLNFIILRNNARKIINENVWNVELSGIGRTWIIIFNELLSVHFNTIYDGRLNFFQCKTFPLCPPKFWEFHFSLDSLNFEQNCFTRSSIIPSNCNSTHSRTLIKSSFRKRFMNSNFFTTLVRVLTTLNLWSKNWIQKRI